MKYAGRLKYLVQRWTTITNNSQILKLIQGLKLPFHSTPQQGELSCNARIEHHSKYANKIFTLVQKGAISKCYPTTDQYLSPYFLVKKPNNTFRFILNLKSWNKFISVKHFKIEDYRLATRLIFKSSYLAKLDLKDAYFLLPIHNNYKKYLRFRFGENVFEFNCLPFGLNIAPYVFTKLLKPIVKFLRNQGCMLVVYLDDILIIGNSYEECKNNVKTVIKLFEYLGFLVNYGKNYSS